MARKGLKYMVFGTLDETTGTYSNGVHLSPAARFNVTITKSTGEDYGDDALQDEDNSVIGGSATIELNDDNDDIQTYLLGHEESNTTHEVSSNVSDVAPLVGVGVYGKSGQNWVAKFYKKMRFSEPDEDMETNTTSVNFKHVIIPGTLYIPEDGEWRLRKTFSNEDAAKSYLNGLVGITT